MLIIKFFSYFYSCLFNIISAAITPGIHPNPVNMNTIRNDPHPWSTTASGGNIIAKIALNNDILFLYYTYYVFTKLTKLNWISNFYLL